MRGHFAPPPPPGPTRLRLRRVLLPAIQLLILVCAAALLLAGPTFADDCGRDPSNLRDCLRTPTAASNMAGTATLVVVVLVNGVEIGRVLLQPPEEAPGESGEEGEGEKEPRTFILQVETRDDTGAIRAVLDADVEDRLTVSAWAVEVGKGPLPEATETIGFSLATPTPYVETFEAAPPAGRRAIGLKTVRSDLRGTPPAQVTVHVSATFEGQTVQASVTVSLTHRQIQFEVLDPVTSSPIPIIHRNANIARMRFTLLDRSSSRCPAPRGGLTFALTVDDCSLADPDETEDELAFSEGQAVAEYEYEGFASGEMRNGGGLVLVRLSDEEGRPVSVLCVPGRESKTAGRFFVIAPLEIPSVRVAIARVAGEGASDHVEKLDNFVVELKDLDVVADTEV